MKGCSHASTNVSGARSNNTEIFGNGTASINFVLNKINGTLESVKDFIEDSALFHTHDSQVIFFTDPDDEFFILRNVATSTMRPVTGDTSSYQVRISRHVLKHDVGFHILFILFIVNEVGVAGSDATLTGPLVRFPGKFGELAPCFRTLRTRL